MSPEEIAERLLNQLGDELQAEANEKIKKAMQLFIRVDATFKGLVLMKIGFSGEFTAKRLRDHFDTMDLIDGLDDVIENMEYELNENQR